MTRKSLITAVAEAAGRCGYAFYTGFEYRINTEADKFPAAWLLPPQLVKKQGRAEGEKHYSVKLKLMNICESDLAGDKEQQWGRMEDAASRICMMLATDNRVRSVTGVQYSPAEFSLTNMGELSLGVEMTVVMPFCMYE